MRTGLFLLLFWVLVAAPAVAQTSRTTPVRQRAAAHQALREARHYPANYKEPYLAVKPAHLKWGRSAPASKPKDGRAGYKFDHRGMARVSEPTAPGLRLRKKKLLN